MCRHASTHREDTIDQRGAELTATRLPGIVLHIGSGKTGTTSVQRFLRSNQQRLLADGVLFPRTPGAQRHVRIGLYATPDDRLARSRDWLRGARPEPEVFRRRLRRRLRREITESGARSVVFSDEGLFSASAETVGGVAGLMAALGSEVRLVAYLRRQDDHLASRYQQVVKQGRTERFAEWSRFDFTHTYDYRARLEVWLRNLEPAAVVVRPFERSRFADGSLYQDFLEAAGLDLRAEDLEQPGSQNESLGVEGVEMLRLLNLHHRQDLGLPGWSIKHGPHVRRLLEHGSGPTLTLPDAELDRFMAQWEASNRAVATELVGDPTGRLFHADRKAGGTTTEQRLDPGRLEHYLTLLEIPAEHHGPLRRIAEREAAR